MEKLVFFNKEGYAYNFNYNESNRRYEGKIFFDENGVETYKTQCIYVFEQVDEINMSNIFDTSKVEFINYSGCSFITSTYSNESVSAITSVNQSVSFYSKWIIGEDFDRKFPKNTIISFSSTTNLEFNNKYFYVVETKPNAFLINTSTNNNIFTYTLEPNITVNSHNTVVFDDINNSEYNKLYNGKVLSIIDSNDNDVITPIDYYEKQPILIQSYNLSSFTVNDTVNIELELFTERPKIFTGSVQISSITNTTVNIKFLNYTNRINELPIGSSIIFEDFNDNNIANPNPIFTITNRLDNKSIYNGNVSCLVSRVNDIFSNFNSSNGLTNKNNKIKNNIIRLYNVSINSLGLIAGDTIFMESIVKTNKNISTQFKILSLSQSSGFVDIRVEQNTLIVESSAVYTVFKKIKRTDNSVSFTANISTNSIFSYSGNTNVYLTNNKLIYSQKYIGSNTIPSIINKFRNILLEFGVDVCDVNNKLCFISSYNYDVSKPYYLLNTYKNVVVLTSQTNTIDRLFYTTPTKLTNEKVEIYSSRCANTYKTSILFNLVNDSINSGFKITLNSLEYTINYNINTQTTLNNFVSTYSTVLTNKGIYVSSGYNINYSGYTLNIETHSPIVDIYELLVSVNLYSTYTIYNEIVNDGVFALGYEISTTEANLFDYNFSTGMIVKLSTDYENLNKEYNILGVASNKLQLSHQGLFDEYNDIYITLATNKYLRRPRNSYSTKSNMVFKFVEPTCNEIFYYDFTGDQLKPYNDIEELTYIGIKPLVNDENDKINLLDTPNSLLEEVNNPLKQQTVFDEIGYELSLLNADDFSFLPSALQINLGYNSENGGVHVNTISMELRENINFLGVLDVGEKIVIMSNRIVFTSNNINFNFRDYGFDSGLYIRIDINDTSANNQDLFNNYLEYKIDSVSNDTLFINTGVTLNNFTTNSARTYTYNIKSSDLELLNVVVMGQTEEEDERLYYNLKYRGIDLSYDTEEIFKESDINEDAIDTIRLNKKRKQMLCVHSDIYNYLGSLKAILNAIKFFGYDDLVLYEYYRNINMESQLYNKLVKVKVDDTFVEVDKLRNTDYKKTNLYNLTYNITDDDGNYVNLYTLEEVQYKLSKLKKWMIDNIMPLSTNFSDITGIAVVKGKQYTNFDSSYNVSKIHCETNVGSRVEYVLESWMVFDLVYSYKLNFYTEKDTVVNNFKVKIITYGVSGSTLYPIQYISEYRNNMDSFTFTINTLNEKFIYIEVLNYNGNGIGVVNTTYLDYNLRQKYRIVTTNFTNNMDYTKMYQSNKIYQLEDGRILVYDEYEGDDNIVNVESISVISTTNTAEL